MTVFRGQDACRVDSNGRVKLSPRLLDALGKERQEMVLYCLPEGAVYPLATWKRMRQDEPRVNAKAMQSIVVRRRLRRFGALSQVETVSNQGRITVPPRFRRRVDLEPGTEAVLVGCETGFEVWNAEKWEKESELLFAHELEKAETEMRADVEENSKKGTAG